MKERADIKPYYHSADWHVNCVITMRKIHKRIRDLNPKYVKLSRFQEKHQSARAAFLGRRTWSTKALISQSKRKRPCF